MEVSQLNKACLVQYWNHWLIFFNYSAIMIVCTIVIAIYMISFVIYILLLRGISNVSCNGRPQMTYFIEILELFLLIIIYMRIKCSMSFADDTKIKKFKKNFSHSILAKRKENSPSLNLSSYNNDWKCFLFTITINNWRIYWRNY
jgi:hypothetical protein